MEKLKIFDKTPLFDSTIDQPEPNITPYLIQGKNNPCIIVCPGGGYCCLAEHEQYYNLFNSFGLSVFVLEYRINPYHFPCQLLDVQRAVKYVKYHAEKFGIDKDKILVAGSSAGGHLAAMACCFADEGDEKGDEIDRLSSSVSGGILCYPVISLCEYTHQGTADALCDADENLKNLLSIQKSAHKGMPPLFVWHTLNDNAVDVRNVLMLAEKYHELEIPIELHIFPDGWHGLGVAENKPHVAQWTSLCKNWLKEYKYI